MTKMANAFLWLKNRFFVISLLSVIFSSSYNVFGYVMPADQLLDFVVENFSRFNTVNIIQSTLQTVDGNEKVFTEQIWLKSPNKYSTKALDRMAERDFIAPDILYRQLFVASSRWRIERILLSLGIDITKTSLTRFNGTIAYRIGNKDTDSPKLIIEKKRFLPLLLKYRIPDKPDREVITVEFQDYQEQDKGWYPFEITYKEGESLNETYTVQTFQANNPIEASILKSFPEVELPEGYETVNGSFIVKSKVVSEDETKKDSEKTDIDKERLRNVIKAFEEQYQ